MAIDTEKYWPFEKVSALPQFLAYLMRLFKSNRIKMKVSQFFAVMLLCSCTISFAGCRTTPKATPIPTHSGMCPSGYSSSGSTCVPNSGSSPYAYYNPGGMCPSGYYASTGNFCVATSTSSCYAYPNGGSSCPNGYSSSSGNNCVSAN
jgi:hypothetical protein